MPKNPHPLTPGPAPTTPPLLDEVDRALVQALVDDGRISNAALARRLGIAESTCVGRVRALRERGVVTGVHAAVDHARLGRPLQAVVAIRLAGHDRAQVEAFGDEMAALPGVVSGTLLTFIPACGDFVNAELLGNTRTRMIGNDIQGLFNASALPTASALSVILMAVIVTMVFVYVRKAGTEELV